MNKIANKYNTITSINLIITSLFLIIYAIIRFKVVFLRSFPIGDENSFLMIFNIYLKEGFYAANTYGNSTTFNFLSSLFFKITSNELMSLRLTSLFSGIMTIILAHYYYKNYFNIPKVYKRIAFITMLNSIIIMSFLFMGINDLILSAITIGIFILIAKNKEREHKSKWIYAFIGVLLSMLILTRQMSILMFPAFFIVLFLDLYKDQIKIKQKLINFCYIIIPLIITLFVFNYPSIHEKGKLSFHDKPTGHPTVNWTNIVYLSAIGEEKGELNYNEYFTIEEVEKYIEVNGVNSLPNSYLEAIFFDLKRTFKEFFVEMFHLIKPFTRLMGLIFIFNIFFLFRKKVSLKKIINNEGLNFSLIYILTLCFVIIAYIDPRWLGNVLIILPIILLDGLYRFKVKNNLSNKFEFIILNVQLFSILIMIIPYLVNYIKV